MDLFPLYNSIRISIISSVIVFFASVFAANYIVKISKTIRGVLDVIFTLPLVLPPTVVGYLILRVVGPKRLICGYIPGKTATIATTVYQLWRINDDAKAMIWVAINIVISSVMLLFVNFFEKSQIRK